MTTVNTITTSVCAGLAVGCLLLAPAARAEDVSFIAPESFATGNSPASVATGDFNGDGLLDLAVGNEFSNNVSVLLGNGDGSFQVPRNFAAGVQPRSLAMGDFNADG